VIAIVFCEFSHLLYQPASSFFTAPSLLTHRLPVRQDEHRHVRSPAVSKKDTILMECCWRRRTETPLRPGFPHGEDKANTLTQVQVGIPPAVLCQPICQIPMSAMRPRGCSHLCAVVLVPSDAPGFRDIAGRPSGRSRDSGMNSTKEATVTGTQRTHTRKDQLDQMVLLQLL
jgi:hypothetical protein